MYKIKLVQENPKVGDIQGNLDLAKSYIAEAKRKEMEDEDRKAAERLAKMTKEEKRTIKATRDLHAAKVLCF